MKITKYFFLSILAVMIFSAYSMNAEEDNKSKYPKEIFGLGARLVSGEEVLGISGIYALQEDMHLGVELGFKFDQGPENGESKFFFHFAPLFRMLMSAQKSFKPFIEAKFVIDAIPYESFNQISQEYQVDMQNKESLKILVGAMWFPYKSVAVNGGFALLSVDLSPARFYGGLMNAFLGIEWYVF